MKFQDFTKKQPLFQTKSLGNGIYVIQDVVGVEMYLIEGDERAILIDTGIGIGNLKDVVEKITNKPIIVYLTHGHVDHAGGIYNFDEVWVAEQDIDLLQKHAKVKFRLDFASAYISELKDIEDAENHMPYHNHIKLLPVCCENKIELGNRKLQVIGLKGHTQGSIGFYDEKTKTLFAGDACNNSTFLFLEEATSVSEYKATLMKLKEKWMERVEHFIICHEYIEIPTSVVEDVINCCDMVIEGRASGQEFIIPYVPFQNKRSYWAANGAEHREKVDGKIGNLIYDMDKIL